MMCRQARRPIGHTIAIRRASLVERLYRQEVFENAEWNAWAARVRTEKCHGCGKSPVVCVCDEEELWSL